MLKKYIIFTIFILSLCLCSGCNRGTSKNEEGLDLQTLVCELPDTGIQGITIYTYDFENLTTTSNWVYQEEEMADFLTYIRGLSGTKNNSPDLTKLEGPFYGIQITADKEYHLLLAGDYMITDTGNYIRIPASEAVAMCQSITGNTRKLDNVNYIINHRYLSLVDDAWDSRYLAKSGYTGKPLEQVEMSQSPSTPDHSTNTLELTITNHTDTTLIYGTPLLFEVKLDGSWYLIDDMLNRNINLGWNSIAFLLEPDKTNSETYYNLAYYQPLPSGQYRLVKEITADNTTGYAACTFKIK